jgi:hypothetical protein
MACSNHFYHPSVIHQPVYHCAQHNFTISTSTEIISQSSSGALSTKGLAFQAAVFTLVALYWPFRIQTSSDLWPPRSWGSFVTWYQLIGWATVDNAVFAVSQAILFWIAKRRSGSVQEVPARGACKRRDGSLTEEMSVCRWRFDYMSL